MASHKYPLHIFCKSHMNVFDFIFNCLAKGDAKILKNLSGHLTGNFDQISIFGNFIND